MQVGVCKQMCMWMPHSMKKREQKKDEYKGIKKDRVQRVDMSYEIIFLVPILSWIFRF